jgi:hypothetical protein
VHGDRVADLCVRQVKDWFFVQYAGVVDQYVDLTARLPNPVDDGIDRRRVPEINMNRFGVPTGTAKRFDGFFADLRSRAPIKTEFPSSASWRAIERPMPRLVPVTRVVLFTDAPNIGTP